MGGGLPAAAGQHTAGDNPGQQRQHLGPGLLRQPIPATAGGPPCHPGDAHRLTSRPAYVQRLPVSGIAQHPVITEICHPEVLLG
jgi:hypothetical protein